MTLLTGPTVQFRKTLAAARAAQVQTFPWYPYDSLANAVHIDRLLGGRHPDLLDDPAGSRILDIGCADGDFAFLLESLGFAVTAMDHPSTNHNGMRGVRALRDLLGSKIGILEADIDSQFTLPPERFRLAVFLGLLYHLKNPFHALERLAKSCDYCLLSTRIARCLPDGSAMPAQYPLAYLLGADELNADDSNYWIFNEAGLRRLISRTQWDVVEWFSDGDTQTSDPVSQQRDERAFCLLRSRYGLANTDLTGGWHEPEDTGWRWVSRQFGASFTGPRERVTLQGFLPEEVLARLGPVTLRISANGIELPAEVLADPGPWSVTRRLPAQGSTAVHFTADKALPPSENDDRELALIVSALNFD